MRRMRHVKVAEAIDLTTRVGSLTLPNPIMSASGTAGHGAELARYFDLSSIGAVVVKSLSSLPWAGNPPPRVHETAAGMINSVGLQGPGIEAWLEHELPALEREPQASGVMMIPVPGAGVLREVRGLDQARGQPLVEEIIITAHPGQELVPWPEGARYPGFIFARGGTPEAVEAALRAAHRQLQFVIASD